MNYPKLPLGSNREIAERIAKLIPRLGSTHDGEVVATAAAIQRTLQAAGYDLHDLATAISTTPIAAPALAPAVRQADTWSDVIDRCADLAHRLPIRDREFIASMLDWDGIPSERQEKWLTDIARRLGIWTFA